jgi:hypothetical protein
MKYKRKECSSCRFFVKWENNKNWKGLCEELDLSTKTDYSRNCGIWKNKKYIRKKMNY